MRTRHVAIGLIAALGLSAAAATIGAGRPRSAAGRATGAAPLADLVGRHVTVHFRGVSPPSELRTMSASADGVMTVNDIAVGAQGFLREVRPGWIGLCAEDSDNACWVPTDEIRAILPSLSIRERVRLQTGDQPPEGR